jgi:beta-1,4-mannosyltransferase
MMVFAQEGKTVNLIYRTVHDALARRGMRLKRFDFWFIPRRKCLVYVHAPDAYMASASRLRVLVKSSCFIISILAAKLVGCRLIWSINNLKSHEGHYPFTEFVLMTIFVHCVNGTIHMSKASLVECLQKYPDLEKIPAVIIPHINFFSIYPARGNAVRGRQLMNVGENDLVILSFGIIRPYKGIDRLIKALKEIDDPQLRLVIAGPPQDEAYLRHISQLAATDRRTCILPRVILDDEVTAIFAASTLACNSYAAILNSGSIMLALTLGCPALAPRMGSLEELQERVGTKWLKLYDGVLNSQVLEAAISWAIETDRGSPELGFSDLERITTLISDFFQTVYSR